MSEALPASNVQVFASNVRPTWPRSETRRNTGSVRPVQPVQPFFKSYKINKAPQCESSADFLAQKTFLRKYLGQVGRTGYALFFSILQELYLGHRVGAPWTAQIIMQLNEGTFHHV